jgi:hypothetical protein
MAGAHPKAARLPSVVGRLLDIVDEENLGECIASVELEPELLLNGGTQRRWRVGAVCWRRNLGSPAAELQIVGCLVEGEVEPPS